MAKISYTALGYKVDYSTKDVVLEEDKIITVRNYLPIQQKNDLVQISLQQAEHEGIYNNVLLDMYFHLNIVFSYTNINFTDKQKDNEFKLYDELKCNGLIDKVIEAIGEEEYNELFDYLQEMAEENLTYRDSTASMIRTIIKDLPKNAETASEIVNSFDKDKYQAVIDFANAANGNRPVTGPVMNEKLVAATQALQGKQSSTLVPVKSPKQDKKKVVKRVIKKNSDEKE